MNALKSIICNCLCHYFILW